MSFTYFVQETLQNLSSLDRQWAGNTDCLFQDNCEIQKQVNGKAENRIAWFNRSTERQLPLYCTAYLTQLHSPTYSGPKYPNPGTSQAYDHNECMGMSGLVRTKVKLSIVVYLGRDSPLCSDQACHGFHQYQRETFLLTFHTAGHREPTNPLRTLHSHIVLCVHMCVCACVRVCVSEDSAHNVTLIKLAAPMGHGMLTRWFFKCRINQVNVYTVRLRTSMAKFKIFWFLT